MNFGWSLGNSSVAKEGNAVYFMEKVNVNFAEAKRWFGSEDLPGNWYRVYNGYDKVITAWLHETDIILNCKWIKKARQSGTFS